MRLCATPADVRSKVRLVVCAVLVGAGCAQAPPPAEPSAVSVSPPPRNSPEPEPETPKPRVPDPPWRVSYHDGSGNGFQFERTSTAESVSYEYSPVTREQSSSGMYSGGEPAQGTLDGEQVARLWKQLLQLQAETTLHIEERGKGTGAFRIVTPAGERSFIVSRGELLRAFDELLAELKKGAR